MRETNNEGEAAPNSSGTGDEKIGGGKLLFPGSLQKLARTPKLTFRPGKATSFRKETWLRASSSVRFVPRRIRSVITGPRKRRLTSRRDGFEPEGSVRAGGRPAPDLDERDAGAGRWLASGGDDLAGDGDRRLWSRRNGRRQRRCCEQRHRGARPKNSSSIHCFLLDESDDRVPGSEVNCGTSGSRGRPEGAAVSGDHEESRAESADNRGAGREVPDIG